MPSQVVAYATQSRNASGLAALDELDDDELPTPHIPSSASRQLSLPRELVLDVDVPKHVPHLAMTLSTALSHLDSSGDCDCNWFVQAPRPKQRTNPRKARFMSLLPTNRLWSPII
jgi:hypothetical protein